MKSFDIVVKDIDVQTWFSYLYQKGELGKTIERIARYYIDFCLRVNEKELEDYFDIGPNNDIFLSRSKQDLRWPPLPFIDFPRWNPL